MSLVRTWTFMRRGVLPGAAISLVFFAAAPAHAQAYPQGVRFGDNATTADVLSVAVGNDSEATGFWSSSFGGMAQATQGFSTAIGGGAYAFGYESTAVGALSEARGDYSAAFGSALAFGQGTTALGTWAYAGGGFDWTGAGGRPGNIVQIVNGTAVGFSSVAAADYATALGADAEARGVDSLALGSLSKASAAESIAIGSHAMASLPASVALGSNATTDTVVATSSTVISGVTYQFAGLAPVGTVSVGSIGGERTLTHLAAGRIDATSTDAVNGSQLFATNQAIEAFGQQLAALQPGTPLAGYTHGTYADATPVYGDGGEGSTALGVEAHAAGIDDAVAIGAHSTVTADSGTAVGQGASATASGAVALGQGSTADRANTVSVGSAGSERQVTNVAAGTAATDAVNKGQLDRGIASANGYTDARVNALSDRFNALNLEMDDRFHRQDERIDRQGAMGAAMTNMAVSAAGIRTPNRMGIGVGFQGGESALSVGYQRAISDRATLTVGGAFSSDDSAIGLGAGFGW